MGFVSFFVFPALYYWFLFWLFSLKSELEPHRGREFGICVALFHLAGAVLSWFFLDHQYVPEGIVSSSYSVSGLLMIAFLAYFVRVQPESTMRGE